MLVLSRKLGETVYVGDNITITVVEVSPGRVRIGIEAPRDVPIRRAELTVDANTEPPTPPEVVGAPRKSR